MKYVSPNVELCTETGLKKIELIGKVCTKKEHNITENSYINFIRSRIKEGHTSIFAHEFVYFDVSVVNRDFINSIIKSNRYIRISDDNYYIAVSYRSLIDMMFYDYSDTLLKDIVIRFWELTPELCYIFNLTPRYGDGTTNRYLHINRVDSDYILKRCPEIYAVTFKFTTNRAIANEIIRHSEIAPMQESTRWINYNKSNGGNIEFINPFDCIDICDSIDIEEIIEFGEETFADNNILSEQTYKDLIKGGISHQVARDIFPLNLKTELYMTGTIRMWLGSDNTYTIGDLTFRILKGFIPQRTAKSAHPQIRELANKVNKLLKVNYSKYYDFKSGI